MTANRRWGGSIRFRLAAWYAAIVLVVIAALGISFSVLLERELRSDVDSQILDTGARVHDDFDVYIDRRTGQLFSTPVIPALYSFPSLLIQVVGTDGTVYESSESLLDANTGQYRLLPTKQEPRGSNDPQFETAVLSGVEIRTVRLPVFIPELNATVAYVTVGEPLIELQQTLDHVRQLLIVGAVLGAAFAAITGWFLAGRALRPVDRITATAASIAEGRGVGNALESRLEVGRSRDELARLSATFNRMLDRLQETFESQRRFIADASHELRTPLTALRGNAEVLALQVARDGEANAEVIETLEDLRRESERMGRLVEDLLLLARAEAAPTAEDRVELVRLDEVVNEAIRVGAGLANGQTLDTPELGAVTVHGHRDRLFQVLLILIDNAIRHTPDGGTITVRLTADRGKAVLTVSDTGSGIAPDHLPHLFERFYRADASRQRGSGGTGLGLAIAKAIVENHDGAIVAASRLGHGTTMTVTLPLASPVAAFHPDDEIDVIP